MDSKLTDRNLIVGVMVLQLNCVTLSQLISALQAWIFQRELLPKEWLLSSRAVVFEIMGDGKSLWKSPVVEADQLLNFEVNITGVNQLELTTAPSDDGTNSDWGLWLEPKLAR